MAELPWDQRRRRMRAWKLTRGRRGAFGGARSIGGVVVGGRLPAPFGDYVLSDGDDFNTLDIIGPQAPLGKWLPVRRYLADPRGSTGTTGLASQYNTDPLHTGHSDSNRGVAVGFDNMSVTGSVVTLQARSATDEEEDHFSPANSGVNGGQRSEIAAILDACTVCVGYPTDTNPIVFRWRARYSAAASNPDGWHPTLWCQSVTPLVVPASGNSDEHDFEGTADAARMAGTQWANGSGTNVFAGDFADNFDGQWHTYALVIPGDTDPALLYIDDELHTTSDNAGNAASKLIGAIMSSHVYVGTIFGHTYVKSQWDGDADGAKFELDYFQVGRKAGTTHWRPLQPAQTLSVDYDGSGSIVLPSKLSLWGDADVTEYSQILPYDLAQPGMTSGSKLIKYPTGVSDDLDSDGRTISVDFTAGTGKAGRLHGIVYGYKADGSTCEPHRYYIDRGPNITAATITATEGVAGEYDLYAACDCGTILPKVITVTGSLPSGFTWSSSTGLITWDDTVAVGSATVTVTCTNASGQEAQKSVDIEIGAAAVASWSTNFTAADGNLEDAGLGFTRVDGIAGGATIASNACAYVDDDTLGTTYQTPLVTPGPKEIEVEFENRMSGGVCFQLTDRNNYIMFRRSSSDRITVFRRISGTLTQQAETNETVTGANVVRATYTPSTQVMTLEKDGVGMTLLSGSLTFTSVPPESDREGIVARFAAVSPALDNLSIAAI